MGTANGNAKPGDGIKLLSPLQNVLQALSESNHYIAVSRFRNHCMFVSTLSYSIVRIGVDDAMGLSHVEVNGRGSNVGECSA